MAVGITGGDGGTQTLPYITGMQKIWAQVLTSKNHHCGTFTTFNFYLPSIDVEIFIPLNTVSNCN